MGRKSYREYNMPQDLEERIKIANALREIKNMHDLDIIKRREPVRETIALLISAYEDRERQKLEFINLELPRDGGSAENIKKNIEPRLCAIYGLIQSSEVQNRLVEKLGYYIELDCPWETFCMLKIARPAKKGEIPTARPGYIKYSHQRLWQFYGGPLAFVGAAMFLFIVMFCCGIYILIYLHSFVSMILSLILLLSVFFLICLIILEHRGMIATGKWPYIIRRNKESAKIFLYRVVASCPFDGSRIYICYDRKYHKHVGKCLELPDQHIYSYDPDTEEGKVLPPWS